MTEQSFGYNLWKVTASLKNWCFLKFNFNGARYKNLCNINIIIVAIE